jgi:hypothetical protein
MMGGTTLATEPLAQQLARLDADRMRRYRENLDYRGGSGRNRNAAANAG